MPNVASLAFVDVKGGMNAADPPQAIAPNQVARMVNCTLRNGLPSTRFGVRVVPLSGDAAEFVALNNVQGSIFFNPAEGQGGIALAESNAMLTLASGGRKWVVNVESKRDGGAVLKEVTAGLETNSELHLVWWLGAENLLLANDGQSNCWIWDTANPARFSAGYNVTDKLKSRVPNGGTVMIYAHNRIVDVVNGRYILVGDILHRTDQSSSANLEEFVEQAYWATGQFFLPPTLLGPIMAAANLPVQNTQHGHGESIFHCRGGIFSIDLNIFPRSAWSTTPMVKTALKSCGATGPYALVVSDGDQYFRTRKGIQTLRSAAALHSTENPNQPISGEVACWLANDYPRWLRFASVAIWDKGNRFLATTGPQVRGRFRSHRGMVVRNMAISETNPGSPAAWEGLWTLSPQMCGIVQFVNGIFDGDERQFAWVRGRDNRTRLVEFTRYLLEDVKEDGSTLPIPAQVITRAIDAGKEWETRQYFSGRLFLRDIVGFVKWGVWVRTSDSPEWVFWRAGTVENTDDLSMGDFIGNDPRPVVIPLGNLPESDSCKGKASEGRWLQLLIRWQGYCTLENVRLTYGTKDITKDDLSLDGFKIEFAKASGSEYVDYEFSDSEAPAWTVLTNETP